MNPSLVLVAALLTPALSFGQSYVVTPTRSGLDTTEGTFTGIGFGSFESGRLQWGEGELRGRSLNLKAFSMRGDRKDQAASIGRSFANMTVRLAATDQKFLDPIFARNYRSTPTTVFQGGIWLPPLPKSGQGPAPFNVTVGFATPYAYSGREDLLIDTTFAGGLRDDLKAWSASPSVEYLLDAPSVLNGLKGEMKRHGAFPGCSDSGTPFQGAEATLWTATWGPDFIVPTYRDSITIEYGGTNFGSGSLVAFAFSGIGSTTGVPFPGLACNQLHLNLGAGSLLNFDRASPLGAVPIQPFRGSPFPYNSALAGVSIWCQAAWTDTWTGQLKLSSAAENQIQRHLGRPSAQRHTIYEWSSASATFGRHTFSPVLFPVIRYTH